MSRTMRMTALAFVALGAKLAKPDKQVVCLHGDGSFGLNAMELDTAVRHKLPILVVISLNGGWTADPKREKPGRDLGYTRYDKMAEAFGGVGINATSPDELKRAVNEALDSRKPTLINAVIDPAAGSESGRIGNLNPQSVLKKK